MSLFPKIALLRKTWWWGWVPKLKCQIHEKSTESVEVKLNNFSQSKKGCGLLMSSYFRFFNFFGGEILIMRYFFFWVKFVWSFKNVFKNFWFIIETMKLNSRMTFNFELHRSTAKTVLKQNQLFSYNFGSLSPNLASVFFITS